MGKIVVDIETTGTDFDQLDEASQEYFLRFADTPEKEEEAKNSLAFFPLTGEVIAIGMLEVESGQGAVYFQNGGGEKEKFKEGDVTYISGSETEILQHFWSQMKRYNQFVTFNGRCFDGPYLMIRSAIHKIQSPVNLVPYRYNHNTHIDLADQLTSYSAMQRRFPLHMWCKAFNIGSPKEGGVKGLEVPQLYREGRYHDIARYCMRDIQATKELYEYWNKYLKF